jgi:hypothetical protein
MPRCWPSCNGLKATPGKLADWNQVAFLFRSVKNDRSSRWPAFSKEGRARVLAALEHVLRA